MAWFYLLGLLALCVLTQAELNRRLNCRIQRLEYLQQEAERNQ